jgi:hypothetical protein
MVSFSSPPESFGDSENARLVGDEYAAALIALSDGVEQQLASARVIGRSSRGRPPAMMRPE